MFESREKLAEDVLTLLEALRRQSRGRYACVLDRSGILFETPEPGEEGADPDLRAFLDRSRAAVFTIPAGMASQTPMDDAFADWQGDEFLLVFINGRVAMVLACPDAEHARQGAFDLLKVMADRLLRYDARYRIDEKGRGLFLGRARIDIIAVGAVGSGREKINHSQ
jgi:hypothetical protein